MPRKPIEELLLLLIAEIERIKLENLAYHSTISEASALDKKLDDFLKSPLFTTFREQVQAKRLLILESARRGDIPEVFGLFAELTALPHRDWPGFSVSEFGGFVCVKWFVAKKALGRLGLGCAVGSVRAEGTKRGSLKWKDNIIASPASVLLGLWPRLLDLSHQTLQLLWFVRMLGAMLRMSLNGPRQPPILLSQRSSPLPEVSIARYQLKISILSKYIILAK
jgi:hypothetical protein